MEISNSHISYFSSIPFSLPVPPPHTPLFPVPTVISHGELNSVPFLLSPVLTLPLPDLGSPTRSQQVSQQPWELSEDSWASKEGGCPRPGSQSLSQRSPAQRPSSILQRHLCLDSAVTQVPTSRARGHRERTRAFHEALGSLRLHG